MPTDLKKIFEQVLKYSLTGSSVLVGCGPGVDTRLFSPIECDGSSYPAISKIRPANAIDYAELRWATSQASLNPQVLSKYGTQCANSTDMSACQNGLMSLNEEKGFGEKCEQMCTSNYLAVQKGDVISSVKTLESLKSFLGNIDSEQEAVLIALANNLDLICSDKSRGAVRKTAAGYEVIGSTGFACGPGTATTQHVIAVKSDGSTSEISSSILEVGKDNCAVGRRPYGLCDAHATFASNALGRYFAAAAYLEAASVPAFLQLRRELLFHHAPRKLVQASAAAAADEVRHARSMSALAQRFGGSVVKPKVVEQPMRSLFEVAKDNAVEGCVRETFGALVAHRQAKKAMDSQVRAEMEVIAVDETRHAELSWEVHAWAMRQLPNRDRRQLRAAQRRAISELKRSLDDSPEPELIASAGLPPKDEAQQLVAQLQSHLWEKA